MTNSHEGKSLWVKVHVTLLLFRPPFAFSAFVILIGSDILIVSFLFASSSFAFSWRVNSHRFGVFRSTFINEVFPGVCRKKKKAYNSAGVRDRKRSMAVHTDAKLWNIRHVCDFAFHRDCCSASPLNLSVSNQVLHCGRNSLVRAFPATRGA